MSNKSELFNDETYYKACLAYAITHSRDVVADRLGITKRQAVQLIDEGYKDYLPIKDVANDILIARDRADLVKNKNTKLEKSPKKDNSQKELFKRMFKAYQQKVIIWLNGGAKRPDGSFDPGVPIKFSELKELIQLGLKLEEEEETEEDIIHIPYANMSDDEWKALITGRGKPDR